MDYMPYQVIRMVQLGLKEDALKSSTIWICVGCHTCTVQCPMAIDMAALMDALRQEAIEEKMAISEPDILNFHNEVLHSVEHYGRAHKLEIMLRYKIRKRDWFQDMDVGIKMLAKRKLDLRPSKVDQIQEVKRLFKQTERSSSYS
jgi:heterodisulfide reductase subunit C